MQRGVQLQVQYMRMWVPGKLIPHNYVNQSWNSGERTFISSSFVQVLFFGSSGNYACECKGVVDRGRRRRRKKGVLQFYVIQFWFHLLITKHNNNDERRERERESEASYCLRCLHSAQLSSKFLRFSSYCLIFSFFFPLYVCLFFLCPWCISMQYV